MNIGNLFKIAKNTTCFVSTKSGKYPRATKSLIPFILNEQEKIVNKVEKHLQTISNLENQITEREQMIKQLMQSILKDAFRYSLIRRRCI